MGRRACVLALVGMGLAAASTKAEAQIYGSFVESCTEIEQRGPFLRALCEDRYGRLVPTQLNLRNCASGQAANRNGRLVCEGNPRRNSRRDYYDNGYREYDRPAPRGYDGSYDRYYAPY